MLFIQLDIMFIHLHNIKLINIIFDNLIVIIKNDIFYNEVNYEKNNNNFFSHITMWLSNHK